jgi:ankyrin repeat protein
MRSTNSLTLLTLLLACAASAKPSYSRSDSVELWVASWSGNAQAVRSIINSGEPDVNWRNTDDDEFGHTSLHVAAKRGHVDAVSILLEVPNCDALAADSMGMTAMRFAEDNKHDTVVAALKRWSFKNNIEDEATTTHKPAQMDAPAAEKAAGDAGGASGSWFSSWFGGGDGDASVQPEL